MENGIKVSDTKNRRGRPNVFDVRYTAALTGVYGPLSHRSIIHKAYMAGAWKAIRDTSNKDDYKWLLDEEKARAGIGDVKFSILTELGRVLQDYGEEHFWEWCKVLCRDKPKTHDAVESIRHWRMAA